MKSARYLVRDTKMVKIEMAERIVSLLKSYVNEANSASELVNKIQEKTPNAKMEFLVCQALSNISEEKGKYRGGTPSLADEILNRQFANVKKYGENAYRLSKKQIMVIARDNWQWLRPEMPQGNF